MACVNHDWFIAISSPQYFIRNSRWYKWTFSMEQSIIRNPNSEFESIPPLHFDSKCLNRSVRFYRDHVTYSRESEKVLSWRHRLRKSNWSGSRWVWFWKLSESMCSAIANGIGERPSVLWLRYRFRVYSSTRCNFIGPKIKSLLCSRSPFRPWQFR